MTDRILAGRGDPDFYSHALVGRDDTEQEDAWDQLISTHTPSWGVTDAGIHKEKESKFLLTRPRGA